MHVFFIYINEQKKKNRLNRSSFYLILLSTVYIGILLYNLYRLLIK